MVRITKQEQAEEHIEEEVINLVDSCIHYVENSFWSHENKKILYKAEEQEILKREFKLENEIIGILGNVNDYSKKIKRLANQIIIGFKKIKKENNSGGKWIVKMYEKLKPVPLLNILTKEEVVILKYNIKISDEIDKIISQVKQFFRFEYTHVNYITKERLLRDFDHEHNLLKTQLSKLKDNLEKLFNLEEEVRNQSKNL